MHELTEQLEQLFGASIIFMTVDSKPGLAAASFQLGHLYTQMSPPVCTLQLTLAVKDSLTNVHPPSCRTYRNMLRVFDGVTRHAHVNSVRTEVDSSVPYPICKVEVKIYDLEAFTKDIKAYQWNTFSEEFTGQLDKVLGEEE